MSGPLDSKDTAPPAAQAPQQPAPGPGTAGLKVCFDGECPLCRAEISVYKNLSASVPITWLDVSKAGAAIPAGTTQEQLLARFHVVDGDGRTLSGASAFVSLWQKLPGWRWLAYLAYIPGALPFMEMMYRGFLKVRPLIRPAFRAMDVSHLPARMVADIRSDHAGETGAVWIYKGILAVSRDDVVRQFAHEHLKTETRHLERMCELLPPLRRSKLLVPWRVAGFVTGALPALAGRQAVFATIQSVETFVDKHYQEQIDKLAAQPAHKALRDLMMDFQGEERLHRDQAADKLQHERTTAPGNARIVQPQRVLRGWCWLVARGSAWAVKLARII